MPSLDPTSPPVPPPHCSPQIPGTLPGLPTAQGTSPYFTSQNQSSYITGRLDTREALTSRELTPHVSEFGGRTSRASLLAGHSLETPAFVFLLHRERTWLLSSRSPLNPRWLLERQPSRSPHRLEGRGKADRQQGPPLQLSQLPLSIRSLNTSAYSLQVKTFL